MAYQLYSSPFQRFYCASPISPAALVCFCTYFMVAIIPFLLVASTQNLWQTQVIGMEQVDMNFQNDNNFHISVLIKKADSTLSTYTISNLLYQNPLNNDGTLVSLQGLTHQSYDYNDDGKVDHLEINLQLITLQGTYVVDADIVIFMGMNFKKYTKIQSYGMLRFKTNNLSQSNLGSVVFIGYPVLRTNQPLPRSKYKTLQIYNENPFITGWMLIDQIYQKYYQRDFRIDAEYQTHVTQCIQPSQTYQSIVNFKILLDLNKQQEVLYKPSFLQLIRNAWVQYFGLLFPSIYFGRFFLQFIYKYKFFSTYIVDNLPKQEKLN
ncbi:transmembrane protein (macronuclear) [Tetrahymena thermophila SB210]|uniref:Transmembrane protein 231 n=1 Tax=Tetrahymena thermophila (strain SB210) TaxID=312017 RepID=I7M9H3_TETTS|nr:transmembrane protein [Tetrahymena thermophila SB210]EAS01752.2 transmembrane protein [Tetrahymena thermophila SB210]|eukprot:XP_001021997.2 transmembrane protein [Tetrahymena thermophila SB210]